MSLPFTIEQFLAVFKQYNLSVFPMQIIMLLFAFISIFLVFKKIRHGNKIISLFLAFFWIWIGSIYHIIFFSSINKSAYFFGALFIVQGILFLLYGFGNKLSFQFKKDLYGMIGLSFVFYGLAVYPALNYFLGHWWPSNPTFGLPCPTTIFTFGLLLWTNKRVPKSILIIPLLWSLIGVSAAINLGIWEDVVLVIAGVSSTLLLYLRDKKINV